ncbi:MAG: hypothetical protein QF921_10765, partial [Pseudomonadales bacterium]|nr:hypothetical protein [Pseudomonadales bacterium]
MIPIDYLVVAATFALLATSAMGRRNLSVLSAGLMVIFGVWATMDFRWQGAVAALVGVLVLLGIGITHLRTKPAKSGVLRFGFIVTALLAILAVTPIYLFPVTDIPP